MLSLIMLALFLIVSWVTVNGQMVYDVALRQGEPYEDIKNAEYPQNVMALHSSIQWNLAVEADAKIKVLCDDIRMGQSEPWTNYCPHVYISFDEGNGITKVCGPNKSRTVFQSKGPVLTVRLVAEDGSGFVKCTAYNMKEPEPIRMDLIKNGRIQLIQLPDVPTPNLDKLWSLRSPSETRISLQCSIGFSDRSPCYKNVFIVDDGEDIKEFCGTRDIIEFSKKNFIKVRIQLDEFGEGKASCLVQAVTGLNANEFLNVVSKEEDSSEYGVTRGNRSTSCECGWTNKPFGRVIHGQEVRENEFPWMVLLYVRRKIGEGFTVYYCGASIISSRHILTAAHCVFNKLSNEVIPVQDLNITLAEHNSQKTSGKEKKIQALEVYVHNNYILHRTHDIALIFTEPIQFSKIIGPVCLSPNGHPVLNRRITIMGWGYTEKGQGSNELLKAKARVIDNLMCGIEDFEMCTHTIPSASCYGDSGGPLVWLDPETNRYTQVSLVSRGTERICEKGLSISTQVAYFYDWIHDIIRSTDPEVQTCSKV